MKKLLAVSVFLCASAQVRDILELPQPGNNPEKFCAVTEIPTGRVTKYETDAKTGFIVADRLRPMPVAHPASYGSLTQSLASDGDPLDVIFYTRMPLAPEALIKLRVTGILKMTSGSGKGDEIVAVPASRIDPTYDDIRELSDLPKIEAQRLESLFRVYKDLPEGYRKVELDGLSDAATARQEIKQVWDAWKEKKPQQ